MDDEDLDQDLLASERVVAVWIQAVQAVGKHSATIESTYMNLEELNNEHFYKNFNKIN